MRIGVTVPSTNAVREPNINIHSRVASNRTSYRSISELDKSVISLYRDLVKHSGNCKGVIV